MNKHILTLGSKILGLIVIASFLSVTAYAEPLSPNAEVDFTKESSNLTPRVGEIYTYTLSFNVASAGTLPINVKVTDPNPAPDYLSIIADSVTGGATYDPIEDEIVWEGTIVPGSLPIVVTFQVFVTDVPTPDPSGYEVTNTAYMVDTDAPGSLPFQEASVTVTLLSPISRANFVKETSNSTPKVGETYTYTLSFNATSLEDEPINIKVTDPNPVPDYLSIIPDSVTGGAIYDPYLDGIVWEGTLVPGSLPIVVTFQVKVIGIPSNAFNGYEVTNTGYMIDAEEPGSLPWKRASVKVTLHPALIYLPIIMNNSPPPP